MRKNWIIRVRGGFIGKVQVHLVANICGLSGLSLLVGVVLCASSVQGVVQTTGREWVDGKLL